MFETINCKEWMMFKLFFLSKEATRHSFSFCKKKIPQNSWSAIDWHKTFKEVPDYSSGTTRRDAAFTALARRPDSSGFVQFTLYNFPVSCNLIPGARDHLNPQVCTFSSGRPCWHGDCLHCAAACHVIGKQFWTIHGSLAHNRRRWSGVKRRTRKCRQTNRPKFEDSLYTLEQSVASSPLFLLCCRDRKSKVKKTLVLIYIGSGDCSFSCFHICSSLHLILARNCMFMLYFGWQSGYVFDS